MTKEDALNVIIKEGGIDTNKISDGYHTFGELYEHRCILFIALCAQIRDSGGRTIWRSKIHSDGSFYEGWFLLGIHATKGLQITYHLPMTMWHDTEFADDLAIAPDFDGHTPNDVLQRIKNL